MPRTLSRTTDSFFCDALTKTCRQGR